MKKNRLIIVLGILFLLSSNSIEARKDFEDNRKSEQLFSTITTDLLAAGISVTASLTGNIPLALSSGLLTKYLTTYGIQGIKKLIGIFKGRPPKDLGEINIYYLYLINAKRNLYQTLQTIRKNVDERDKYQNVRQEIRDISDNLLSSCDEEKGCPLISDLDDSLTNYSFVNFALDVNQSFKLDDHLKEHEIKNTYHYLMMLYLDVVIVEQKLQEGQFAVLANTLSSITSELNKSGYICNEEKEFKYQLMMNVVLRWLYLNNLRKKVLSKALHKPLEDLSAENEQLDDILDQYR